MQSWCTQGSMEVGIKWKHVGFRALIISRQNDCLRADLTASSACCMSLNWSRGAAAPDITFILTTASCRPYRIWHSDIFNLSSKSCPLKEWACDSCIFLLFINWRLEYLLHGDSSRKCYGLYNKYLLSVFYNLVNFIYPLPTTVFTDS